MDQTLRVRARRTLPLLGALLCLTFALPACAISNEDTEAILVANRAACAGLADEIDHVNSLADAGPEEWADAIDEVAASFTDRAQVAPDPSRVRSSFLDGADVFSQAADLAREQGTLTETELEGVNNSLLAIGGECAKFTG